MENVYLIDNYYQTSICKQILLSGVSLHNGRTCSVRFLPALPQQGVVFEIGGNGISATIAEVPKCTNFMTELSNKQVHVQQIEHIMAALAGIEVDNVTVQLLGDVEPPILDGSCGPIANSLLKAGIRMQNELRTVLRVTKSVCVKDDSDHSRYLCAEPADGLTVACEVPDRRATL